MRPEEQPFRAVQRGRGANRRHRTHRSGPLRATTLEAERVGQALCRNVAQRADERLAHDVDIAFPAGRIGEVDPETEGRAYPLVLARGDDGSADQLVGEVPARSRGGPRW